MKEAFESQEALITWRINIVLAILHSPRNAMKVALCVNRTFVSTELVIRSSSSSKLEEISHESTFI